MSTPGHRQHHPAAPVVVGIDVGGTKTNATVVDEHGAILVDRMVEVPSCVTSGPDAAVTAIEQAMAAALDVAGVNRQQVRAVGLDTPGPATADGVISVRGATNFAAEAWWGFDIRAAVEDRLSLPVIYNNDGNAAALYAHEQHYGPLASQRSSISAIVGTGLGGGVIESGRVVKGASGMAGELGHVHVPLEGILAPDQPVPTCNCGFRGDLESVASLAGITRNLLPYWLTRYPDHPLHELPVADAAKQVRSYGERGDELALTIFSQQAAAIGRMFTIAANFTDPDAYFLGGGVTEAAPHFRDWFLAEVRAGTTLRAEQESVVEFVIVADLDMAGARGSAFAALHAIRP
jgi:predicted NBD/HSP70 family sugar kinase